MSRIILIIGCALSGLHSLRSCRRGDHAADNGRQTLPGGDLGSKLLLSGTRQRVILGAPVVLRRAPGRLDQPTMLQTDERCVDGAFVHRELVAADLLETPRDSIPVH